MCASCRHISHRLVLLHSWMCISVQKLLYLVKDCKRKTLKKTCITKYYSLSGIPILRYKTQASSRGIDNLTSSTDVKHWVALKNKIIIQKIIIKYIIIKYREWHYHIRAHIIIIFIMRIIAMIRTSIYHYQRTLLLLLSMLLSNAISIVEHSNVIIWIMTESDSRWFCCIANVSTAIIPIKPRT